MTAPQSPSASSSEHAPTIRTLADARSAGANGFPPDLPTSTYAALRETARRNGDANAITFFLEVASHKRPERWTYRRLFADVTRFANLLHLLGVRAKGVTALMLPNLPETEIAIWGAEAAGVVMPVNPLLEPSAIAAMLTAAKARVLVTLSPFPRTDLYEKAVEIVAAVPTLRHVVLIDMTPHVAGLKSIGARLLAWRSRRSAATMPRFVEVHRYAKAMRPMRSDRLDGGRRIAPDDVASYFCTGGTTGLPKIAVRTHGQELSNAWMTTRMMGQALSPDSIIFCGLPLFHVNAVIATSLSSFLRGTCVLLGTPQGFRAPGIIERFWEIIAHHRITAFSGVPTLLNMLLEKSAAGHDLSSFRYAFSGAAPLSAELLRRFEMTFGVAVVEGYGLTETACVASMNPVEGEHRPGSVGLPIPMQEIRTVKLDVDGLFVRDTAPDEIGVVALAGPNVFSGYLDETHNKGLWIDRGDGRRWLNTGDLGRIDAEGYLWLTGRAKDIIIRGGHNIDPSVIEEALACHPDVAISAAVGRPDSHAGEVPVAFVQLRPGAQADETALLGFASATISERAAVPKAITFVREMPLTPIGKIHKPTLRLRALEDVVTSALAAAGVAGARASATSRPKLGDIVRVVAPASERERVAAVLGLFAFAHEFEANGSSGPWSDTEARHE